MRRTIFGLLLAAPMFSSCNPATGDGTQPANRSIETPSVQNQSVPTATPNVSAKAEDDALVPNTQFDAIGQVLCVTPGRRSARDCTAGVIRNRDGSATVTIFSPEGRSRAISFDSSGTAIGVDTAEADGSARQPFTARRGGARTNVTLGPERYEIPDSLVSGG